MDAQLESSTLEKIPSRTRINLWVSSDMHKLLEGISLRDNRSLSDLIREALRDFLSKDRKIANGSDSNKE